jgi:thiol-disulfide isomerase/thioredoxin
MAEVIFSVFLTEAILDFISFNDDIITLHEACSRSMEATCHPRLGGAGAKRRRGSLEYYGCKPFTMDFASFRGKYVYIDMWASWCGPCTKEVPHLKKLEEELKNENVVFLSISIDKKVEPWLNKMNALDMHGNQWISTDNKIAEVLNVKGIPFFLIYDKEGKLYIYNAPRPSSGDTLKLLLENLN